MRGLFGHLAQAAVPGGGAAPDAAAAAAPPPPAGMQLVPAGHAVDRGRGRGRGRGAGRGRLGVVSKFGHGRHGSSLERRLLSKHMAACKMQRKAHGVEAHTAQQVHTFLESESMATASRGSRLEVRVSKRVKPTKSARSSLRTTRLKLVVRKPKGSRCVLSIGALMDAAFSTRYSLRAMASIHNMSTRSIQRSNLIGAVAYMHCQKLMVDRLTLALQHAKPAFAILHEMWDETGERLSIKSPDMASRKVHAIVEVFVSRLALTFGWENVEQPITVELVTPPGLVPTPSASNIWNALLGGPFTGPLQAALRQILSFARLAFILSECDAASGNDKLHAFALELDQAGFFREQHLCGLHQNHLIVTSLLGALASGLTSRMYSLALLLRTHGYFLRLHRAAREVLDCENTFAVAHVGSHSRADQEFAAEVAHYLLVHDGLAYESSDNVVGMGRAHREDASNKLRRLTPEDLLAMDVEELQRSGRSRGQTALIACLKFMRLVTGPLQGQVVVHHHSELCGWGATCKEQVSLAIRNFLLRHLPAVPVTSRWTKVGSCVDFLVGGLLCCNLLPRLFEHAFTIMGTKGRQPRGHCDDELDIEEWQQMNWHQVTSKRVDKSISFLQSRASMAKLLVLAVVLEPLRYLTTWLLNAAREVQNLNSVPVLCDILDPERSIFIVCAQYLSSLLRGVGGRLQFIFKHLGKDSFDVWCREDIQTVATLQVAVITAASWLYRRHIRSHDQYPWR